MTLKESTAESAARSLLQELLSRDAYASQLGMKLVDASPGRAAVRMQVSSRHLNFNGSCHGGAILSLADTAFGLASSTHGHLTAGIDVHATFTVAARGGDTLTASAREVSRSRRLGVYLVEVARSDGTLVATFTGTVYVSQKSLADPVPAD